MLAYLHRELGRPGLYAPDALAVAATLKPGLVTRSEKRAVTVELAGTHTRGQSSVDWFNLSGQAPNVNVILEIDFERFWGIMRASVSAG